MPLTMIRSVPVEILGTCSSTVLAVCWNCRTQQLPDSLSVGPNQAS